MSAKVINHSLKRRIQAYPSSKYHKLVNAYASVNEMKTSKSVSIMIKDFFDRMPEAEKQRILVVSASKHSY